MGRSSLVGLCVFLFSLSFAQGQKNRYMVFFKDKAGTPFDVNVPSAFLSQKAIERRINHDVPVTEQDLPVNPAYVQLVRDAGGEVFFQTRWMNGVLIQAGEDVVAAVSALAAVDRVELVGINAKLSVGGRKRNVHEKKSNKSSTVTDLQLKMLGMDQMHSDGFHGEGVTIAILDSGFEGVNVAGPFKHIFDEGRIDLTLSKDYVYNSGNVFQYDDHGTEVFSVIGAYQDGAFTGGAYEATFQLYVTEEVPTEYRVEEYNWIFAAERADSAGVDVIHSSLGYYDFDVNSMDYLKSQMDGETAVVTRAAQWAADRGIIVVTSAGNEGNASWQIITAPADAEDILAVANVDVNLIRANSSSIGPSADQRIKPDLAALGTATSVVEKTGTIGKSSGTSLAAPLITGLVAGIRQKYPALTNEQILEALRKSASQGNNPDNLIGYGIPNFRAVVNYLEPVSQLEDFEVVPNPFDSGTNFLTIRPKNPQVENCVIEILSSEGRSVFQANPNFSFSNNVYAPDLSSLAQGLYFLRIRVNDRNYTFKLVKNL